MYLYYNFDDIGFDYEISWDDEKNALRNIIRTAIGSKDNEDTKKFLDFIISDLDISDVLEERFQTELQDYFESEARAAYDEACVEDIDKSDWYGTKAGCIGV